MIKLLGVSWRTGLTGLLSLLAAIGMGAKLILDGNYNFGDPLWIAIFASVLQSLGLMKARDDKVSTEEVRTQEAVKETRVNP